MKQRTVLVGILVSVVLLAGCIGNGGPGDHDADVVVAVGEMYFQQEGDYPANELQAAEGDVILFHNEGSTTHTVTIEELDVDEMLQAGDQVLVTAEEPGTFTVNCEVHPDHDAELTVE